ncbi:uncharacterized protein BDZ99DRAFT_516530 [Mytilinidion resinicola]|uniref:NACHT domain-containing protein n=1 Tax=Mytilinidion resinicola TaxID=574789 RepID=A0A6A6YY73_9PEZI|nr:uncharacterized protein BDZ99DRAFT_516530 [Mytilinidion resinicola]KAF2813896.1 hypothetical protein BDZ99DRAFT_516530 [Mytilinidion resinicola]
MESKEESDLAAIWSAAVREYEKRTGKSMDPRFVIFKSMDEVMKGTEKESQSFGGFRHDGSKVDKVRAAFGNNLGTIQKVLNGIQTVGNVAAVFPPAMPVSLVFTAFGQVLQSFVAVKADYDKVERFFANSQRFLDRLSILEKKTPSHEKWLSALWDGTDSDLEAAYSQMETAIEELGQAVGFATFREIRETREELHIVDGKVDKVQSSVLEIHQKVGVTNEYLHHANEGIKNVDQNITGVKTELQKMTMLFTESIKETQNQNLREMSRLKAQEPQKNQKSHANSKMDVLEKKHAALEEIRKHFKFEFSDWSNTRAQLKAQIKDIREDIVPGTAKWLCNDQKFTEWIQGPNPVLWITGGEGTGKSFLAYAAAEELRKKYDDQDRISVAYFCFREEAGLQSIENCLASLALQIAEHDGKYRDQLRAELKRETDETTWQRFFTNRYTAKSDGRLFLVLDGLDELNGSKASSTLIEYLAQREEGNLHIRMLLSCRRTLSSTIAPLNPEILTLTRENLSSDMTLLIKSRCNSLPRLKKFPRPVLREILKKVKSKADGMLYIEHMLRRLSYIGRQGAVLKDLEKNLPDDLQALYQLLLDECHRGRTDAQYKALKRLFAWLAYSKRSLTLEEAEDLVKMTVPDGSFDVEDEIIGPPRSSFTHFKMMYLGILKYLRGASDAIKQVILELARTVDDEEDGIDEGDDDSDSAVEKVDLEQLGNEQANLTFQERSLREFFKAVDVDDTGLRTPPSTAHFTIFEMATSTLITAAQKDIRKDAPVLSSYAANYWYQHLIEIDLENTSDVETIQVLNALQGILSNAHNVSVVIETFEMSAKDTYPDSGSTKKVTWIDVMMRWIAKGAGIKDLALPSETREWISSFSEDRAGVLIPLARGHVNNWYRSRTHWTINRGFSFAKAALEVWKSPDENPDNMAKIQQIADRFPDIQGGAGKMRAIGTMLTWEDSEKAVEYLREAFDLYDNNKDKFCCGWLLADAYENLAKREEAVDAIDKALATLPPDWKEDTDFVEWKEWVLITKASLLSDLERTQDAIDAYNEARTVNQNNTIGGWRLNSMAKLLTQDNDPEGRRLLDMLRSWTTQERCEYLDWILDITEWRAVDPICRSAKMNNDEGLKFLNDIVKEYEQYRPAKSPRILFLHSELAAFFGQVLGDEKKAKEMYHDILATTVKEEDLEGLQSTFFSTRLGLANLIFSEFLSSTEPAQKVALLEEMRNLPAASFAEESEQDLDQSQVGVMLAIMLRSLGPAIEYQAHMQKVFQKCVNGLTDAEGWNDMSSFRLLSKVLACMEGLERDALIALSCQFSVMNPELIQNDSSSSKSSENGDEADDAAQTKEGGQTEPTDADSPITNEPAKEAGIKDTIKADALDETEINRSIKETPDPVESIVIRSTTTTITTMTNDPNFEPDTTAGASEETENVQVEGSPDKSTKADTDLEPVHALVASSDLLEASDDAKPAKLDNPTLERAPDEEIAGFSVWCDGQCGTKVDSWTTPIYYCIICACTDLCTSCHAERLGQNHGAPSESWKTVCGKDHKYIKGPIEGWKGVKNGVMRLEDEEIPFQEWLKDLEEKRWKDAWTTFWKGGSGIKDIGT